MAFCGVCGGQVAPQASFCPHCGSRRNAGGNKTIKVQGPKLLVSLPGQAPVEYPFNGVVGIGREKDNQIVVPLAMVSRHHAQIVPEGAGFAVIDLESANGTYLQGRRIPEKTPVPVPDGGIIRIGDSLGNSITLKIQLGGTPQSTQTVKLNQAHLAAHPRLVIGRDPGSDLCLNSPLISWRHAEIVRTAAGHELRDLGSTNGTFVNGRRVTRHNLQLSDQIQIGSYRLIYDANGLTGMANIGSIRLDAVKLTKVVRLKGTNGSAGQPATKAILNNVTLTVMPREFVALVGGSGAGKSTLMDALNGFRRVPTGRVLVNGDDLYQNYDVYRADMGYVPQYDILHENLTVRQALRYTAMLRLPPDTTQAEIGSRVEQALKDVQMEKQIDQRITSLSGGQRKRVSIAAELLSDPSLFFLDEPTSGLDPGLDKRMMTTLNQLSDSGRTVIMTTHATNNINNNCNLVAFMAFGRLVYYGPPADALAFFGVGDFADIYNLFKDPKDAEACEARFTASPYYQQYVATRQTSTPAQANQTGPRKPAGMGLVAALRQFRILAERYLNLVFGSPFQMFVLFAVMPIIGLLLLMIANGSSFVGDSADRISEILRDKGAYHIAADAQKLMLMISLSAILLGMFASAYEVIREIHIFRRERMVNLGIVPYLASKGAVLLGFGVLQCIALLLVIGRKVELPADGVFLPAAAEIFLTLFIALFVGVSIGLLISASVKAEGVVIYIVLVILFMQIIFAGTIFELPDAAQPLSAVTPARWAMEALGATINIDALNDLSQTEIDRLPDPIETRITFHVSYERSKEHLLKTWIILGVFAAACLGLAGWQLKRQVG